MKEVTLKDLEVGKIIKDTYIILENVCDPALIGSLSLSVKDKNDHLRILNLYN